MADSKIWTNPASDNDPFSHLEIPENLDELVKKAREASRDELRARTRRFRARATHRLMMTPIYRAVHLETDYSHRGERR